MEQKEIILKKIEKLVSCFEQLLGEDYETVLMFFDKEKVLSLINEIEQYYRESQFQQVYGYAEAEVVSVKVSMERVRELAQSKDEKMNMKLEYELLPLAENLRLFFYYYNWVYPDKDKMQKFFEEEVSYYYRNRYMQKAKKEKCYKYDLSILVIAYNKLDVTKMCIESLKRYLPNNISYEIILFNHGSSDETKEYFESQHPDKQIDIPVNQGGSTVAARIMEGKYCLGISNDVLITANSIENLYKCISSDDKIGWAVPTTPNVSNLQSIEANYSNIDEMYAFAQNNNISDEKRWEEKPRLCDPVSISRIDYWFDIIGKRMLKPVGTSFPDDRTSYVYRREGYKQMLVKDAYCYHFGSVTIGEEINSQRKARQTYTKGRISFIKELGMDPWGYGMCYDVELINKLHINDKGCGNLLGINSGIGANLLKIKSILKEKGESNISLTYLTQYDMNLDDLRGLGDMTYKVNTWAEFDKVLTGVYDMILLENGVSSRNIAQIKGLQEHLSEKGVLLVRVEQVGLLRLVENSYKTRQLVTQRGNFWVEIIA